jgi:hypothetical protein
MPLTPLQLIRTRFTIRANRVAAGPDPVGRVAAAFAVHRQSANLALL